MTCVIPGNNIRGFTIMELISTFSMLGILCAIAIPAFSSWLPEYRLKSAVRDLYSNLQLARVKSIKYNRDYRIIFDVAGKGYSLVSPDGTVEREISFVNYDKNGGIGYGGGKATKNATVDGGTLPVDGVSYQYNKISFDPRGLGSGMGYAYLKNKRGTSYAIGSWITGIIVLKKWNEAKGRWE